MSLAEATRDAVRARPFLLAALRAGVVNYAAAARYLDVGDEDAVVAALRRFAEDLGPYEPPAADARVTMQRGLGDGDPAEALLVVGETALVAAGDVGPAALRRALGRLDAHDLPVRAAAVDADSLVVVLESRDGPRALREVEAAVSGAE